MINLPDFQLSLSNFISQRACHRIKGWVSFEERLTDADINQIVNLLGGRSYTKDAIRNNLKYNLININNCGIFQRLICENGSWSYIAGQDYPSEITTIRNLLKK